MTRRRPGGSTVLLGGTEARRSPEFEREFERLRETLAGRLTA